MDKQRERATVEAFLSSCGHSVSCLQEWDRERPDAIIKIEDDFVGVEVTTVIEATRRQSVPPQMWVREATRIVQATRAAFERRHDAALVVRLELRAEWRPGATNATKLADEFAALIARTLMAPRAFDTTPITLRAPHPELSWMYIDRARHSLSGCWAPSFAGDVQRASAEDICATVAKKEGELPAYRKTAAKVWLLIDCDLSGQGISLDVPEPQAITSQFDRIFCCGFGMWQWVEIPVRHREPAAG